MNEALTSLTEEQLNEELQPVSLEYLKLKLKELKEKKPTTKARTRTQELIQNIMPYINWDNETFDKDRKTLFALGNSYKNRNSFEELEKLFKWVKNKNALHPKAVFKLLVPKKPLSVILSVAAFAIFLISFLTKEIRVVNPSNNTMIVNVTAYSSTRDQTDSTPFITASQERVREGIVACPRSLNFGTQVEIKGRRFVCTDRMNIRYQKRFDVWLPTKKQALEFGNQILAVRIIK